MNTTLAVPLSRVSRLKNYHEPEVVWFTNRAMPLSVAWLRLQRIGSALGSRGRAIEKLRKLIPRAWVRET